MCVQFGIVDLYLIYYMLHVKNYLLQKNAKFVSINRFGLSSKEYEYVKTSFNDISEIENKLFKENIEASKVSIQKLRGKQGIRLATELLKILRQSKKTNEKKGDYQKRLLEQSVESLQLKEVVEDNGIDCEITGLHDLIYKAIIFDDSLKVEKKPEEEIPEEDK